MSFTSRARARLRVAKREICVWPRLSRGLAETSVELSWREQWTLIENQDVYPGTRDAHADGLVWRAVVTHFETIVELLHDVQFGRVHDIVNVHVLRGEHALARAWHVTLTVDLLVVEIDRIGEVGFEIQLTIAFQAFEAELVVEGIFHGTNTFGNIDELLAATASIARCCGKGGRWRGSR